MPEEPWYQLVHLVKQCSARIEDDAGRFLASVFFVARGAVSTFAHVARGCKRARRLRVRWSASSMRVRRADLVPPGLDEGRRYPLRDLAPLTVDAPDDHPTVWLSQHTRAARTRAMAIGFGKRTPATVCGIVKAADTRELAEGWIVPSEQVFAAYLQLVDANAAEHRRGSAWRELATRRVELTRRLFGVAEPTRPPDPPSDPPLLWWLDPRRQVVDFHPRPDWTRGWPGRRITSSCLGGSAASRSTGKWSE